MLKSALSFAGSALILGLVAPMALPYLNMRARQATDAEAPRMAAVQVAPAPSATVSHDVHGEASIQANANGQYPVVVTIEGQPVQMWVDTGATMVSISSRTAERIGAVADLGKPLQQVSTANGVATVTPTTLRSVSLDGIFMTDVQAQIMGPSVGDINLLGMSFLKRLVAVEQRDGWLILKQ